MSSTALPVAPATPSIDLHFDQVIENPMHFFHWCIPPEYWASMRQEVAEGYAFRVLFIAQLKGDYNDTYELREVKDPFAVATFITFPKPGEWHIGVFLFRFRNYDEPLLSADKLESSIRTLFMAENPRKYRYRGRFEHRVDDPVLIDEVTAWSQNYAPEKQVRHGLPHLDHLRLAKHVVKVIVPTEIFAPEPSRMAKAFANYFFFGHDARDQCVFRRRMLGMTIGFGFVPYLMVEAVKHLFLLLGGIIAFLLGFEGCGRMIGHAFMPAVNQTLEPLTDLFEGPELMSPFKGRWYLVPAAILVWFGLGWGIMRGAPIAWHGTQSAWAWLTAIRVLESGPDIGRGLLILLGTVFGMVLLVWYRDSKVVAPLVASAASVLSAGFREAGEWHDRRQKVKREAKKRATKASLEAEVASIDRRSSVLICSPTIENLKPAELPPEMQTVRLRFAQVKRRVCRPFG